MATHESVSGASQPHSGWRAVASVVALVFVTLNGAPPSAFGVQRGAARVLFVQLETGNIGCGDRMLAVPVVVEAGEDPLRVALDAILTHGAQLARTHGLYSALGASELAIEDLTVVAGLAKVYLAGTLSIHGECDIPRVREQLRRTATQFREIRAVEFFVNGVPLEDLLAAR